MHDHDPRRSQLMARTSPPRVCDFTSSTQVSLKQQHQHQQNCQQQALHHQMQHHQYQQQQYPQNHLTNQHLQHQIKKCGQFSFTDANFPTNSSSSACDSYNVDEFEDVDEDQISDLDEEEELRLSYERYRQNFHKQPDVTSQLLEFADMVSADIRKFFGRTTDHEDSCDVYEDKWVTAKSGRELYYADLLRIAQGDTEPVSKSTKKSPSSLSSPSSSSLSHEMEFDNRSRFSGKRNDSVGMGPLSELFEFGFPSYMQGDHEHRKTSASRSKVSSSQTMSRSHKVTGRVVPMFERKFPESFWREPCVQVNGITNNCLNRLETSQHMLSSSKLPDFSDLVESWQGGIEGVAASEIGKGGLAANTPGEHHRLQ